jgi:DNA-directed RNA polymerase beta subunit
MTSFNDLAWTVLDNYFEENKNTFLVKHLINTYNDFVLQKLEQIINGFNSIDIYHQYIPEIENFQYYMKINILNPALSKPIIHEKDGSTKIMTPNDARSRNFTYAGNLYVDIEIETKTYNLESKEFSVNTKRINGMSIGKLPIMVRSNYCVLSTITQHSCNMGECPYDYGGYFVVNGNEKIVISQDRIAENKTYVFLNTKATTFSYTAEIRSTQDNVFSVPKITTIKMSSKSNQYGHYIKVNIHHIKHDIPLFVLFRALGVESDRDIIDYIHLGSYDPDIIEQLVGSADDGNFIVGQKDAHDYMLRYLNINGHPREFMAIRSYKMNLLQNILKNEFLPHIGPDFKKKALYLGYMVNKLIKCFTKKLPMDDRDSYINKRVDTPGILMANLFRQYYGKLIKDMRNMLQKEVNNGSWKATNNFINVINKVNINKIIKSTIIESGIKYGLATGNWGIKNNKTKQGVAQVLNRMTYNATISHLRRINTPIEKSGKLIQPRKLHATQWGVICPCETPEGASVGLVKNLAIMTYVTSASCSLNVRGNLERFGVIHTSNPLEIAGNTLVVVNGDIVGYHTDPVHLIRNIKNLKLHGGINIYTSVCWKHNLNEIHMCTEGGRCVRPLFVIEDNKAVVEGFLDQINEKKLGWNEINMSGIVEYIDVEEANVSMIAMKHSYLSDVDKKNINYTHLELHPSLILGALAGSIPFSDHNQAPRNTYQCLWVEEPVLMRDGTWKKIKDVVAGDMVVTFNPTTMEPDYTKVVNQYVRPTRKPIVKITTETGREIVVTNDHLFMTNQGWIPARDLMKDGVKAGIYIHPSYNQHVEETTWVDRSGMLVLARIIGNKLGSCENIDDMLEVEDGGTIPKWVKSRMFAKEFLSGFHSVRINHNGFVRVMDDPDIVQQVINMLADVMNIDVSIRENGYRIKDITQFMNTIGIAYNYEVNMSLGLKAEYRKYWNRCPIMCTDYVSWTLGIDTTYNTQFQRVTSIELQPNCMIADITTESDNHCFIGGNGFMVHNSAMGKQAIGLYSMNYQDRYDSIGHVLNYPQKPIVFTKTAQIVNVDDLPCGMNVIVAIATYTGFNQEDSVIMNKSSIERGMFQSTVYRTYKDQNNKNHSTGEEEFYCHPGNEGVKQLKPYNYSKLGSNGFVPENTCVNGSDVIIGKCMPQKINGVIVNKDMSCPLKNNEVCFIDKNCAEHKYFNNTNGDGYNFSKIRVRSDRIPTIGDKFSCYTADHEVLTTQGWVYVSDLNFDHKIATLVKDNLVYQYPIALQKYEYNAKFHVIETRNINLQVTPNHRMYVSTKQNKSFACKMAKDIGKNVYYKKNANVWYPVKDARMVYGKDDVPEFMTNPETKMVYSINYLISSYGQWIVEGTCNSYMFGFLNTQDMYRFPSWVWALSMLQCRELIYKISYKKYSTSINDFADDYQRLCIHAGWACDKIYNAATDMWDLYIARQDTEPLVLASEMKVKAGDNGHNGYVYCCTVPLGEGVICVRRQGIACFCGQSRHGQKGTVGMIYRQEDMPFTKDGLVPDIIMNPHAVPSRMTIGQLMECIMGKSCVVKGTRGDGTPFTDVNVEDLADSLQTCGLERYGNEIMYNSRTGEMMETEIFIGPTYYQRLKHLVQDKVHSRSNNGPVVMLTRQPAEGRARDGGLRLGEMEVECKWAHGCMQFAKERFMECSDNYRLFICKTCGMTATAANPEKNIWLCKACKNTTNFSEIRLPYACKLLFQEIQTMNIAARFTTI